MEDTRNAARRRLKKENRILRGRRNSWVIVSVLALAGVVTLAGCYHSEIETSEYEQGPAPRRLPSPEKEAAACGCYEDSLTGGQVFKMYCSYCHNAPNLGERSFANFKNVAAHMRVRANLTGKEYAKLMEFLGRWHDVPPHAGVPEPSPKRLTFSQPMSELRPKSPEDDKQQPPPPADEQ